jgi:hypothetical protein
MKAMRTLIYVLTLAASLTACGGGGGNPGTCSGSALVCGGGSGVQAVSAAPLVDASRISTVICADMASLAQALAYLAAGATQLDADSDGKPCEDNFPGQ